jgi:uncharacterized repeat protein (TIGR02543 family)
MVKVFAVVACWLAIVTGGEAASFSVTSTADSGPGSLRQAILDSNASPELDEIDLAGVSGTIHLDSTLPALEGEVSITGAGAETLTISGGERVRLMSIAANAVVVLQGVTLADGTAESFAHGGAILNSGDLTVRDCTFRNNRTKGGFGGAIYNKGEALIVKSRFSGNQAVGGAAGGSRPGDALGGGGGGFGGAIYSTGISLRVEDTVLLSNTATGGSGAIPVGIAVPERAGSGGGPEGGLGGIHSEEGYGVAGEIGGYGSGGGGGSEAGNLPSGVSYVPGGDGGRGGFGGGGGGAGGATGVGATESLGGSGGIPGYGGGPGAASGTSNSGGKGGGGAGFGGAVFIEAGNAVFVRAQFSQNTAVGGAGGGFTESLNSRTVGGGGGAGLGGALFLFGGTLLIEDTSLRDNRASGGRGGAGDTAGPGAMAGGGAIVNYGGELQIVRSTVASNEAWAGSAGVALLFGGVGGDGFGGGLACVGGATRVVNSTFSQNLAVSGTAYPRSYISYDTTTRQGVASGGGIRSIAPADLFLLNCTIAQNIAQGGLRYKLPSSPGLGGGICAHFSTSIQNNLFSGNTVRGMVLYPTVTPSDGEGNFISLGHNLFETDAKVNGLVPTDITNVPAPVEPLTDNGGFTLTHAIPVGSPAVDAGRSDGAPATDQRGESRPQGPAVDIGAHERAPLTVLLNDNPVLPGAITRNAPLVLRLEATYPIGAIVYTLDGSTPTLASTVYRGPVSISESVTIRAVAFNPAFTASVAVGPVNLTVIPARVLNLTVSGQGTVAVNPPAGPYENGTTVTLAATPAPGWRFQGWSGDLSGSTSPVNILMDDDKNVQATFVPIPTYTLTTSVTGQGQVSAFPSAGLYLENTSVTVTAQAAEGWKFTGWSGDATGTQNSLSLKMDGNKQLHATFRRIVTLTATTLGGGSVSVTPPNGTSYFEGDTVTATATAAAGWQFLHWKGGVSSTSPSIDVVLTGDTAVEAVFGTTLTLNAVGNGAVSAEPSLAVYPFGTAVRLTGIPAAGNRFYFWSSPITSESNPVDFQILTASPLVSGVFAELGANEAAITATTTGSGNVSVNPAGTHFPVGTELQLTAVAVIGHEFTGWSGDVSGMQNPLSVTLSSSKLIVANFAPTPRYYTISVSTSGQGSVQVAPATGPYLEDTIVTLTAQAVEGWTFTGWSGDATGTQNPLPVTLTSSKLIVANFLPAVPSSIAFESSDPVPGEPPGTASFHSFGVPAINEAGQLAFRAMIKTDGDRLPAIFAVDGLVARKGEPAPDAAGGLASDLVFKDFSEPVLDELGKVAFIAVTGKPASSKERRGIWSDAGGTALSLIALEGEAVPGLPGSKWTEFRSISLQDGQLLFSAEVKQSGGDAAKRGLWTWTAADGIQVQVLEGTTSIDLPDGMQPMKSFVALSDVAGSLAQARSHASRLGAKPGASIRVTLKDKTQAILIDDEEGKLDLTGYAATGMPVPDESASPLPALVWDTFGIPAWSMDGSRLGFLATLASASGEVSSKTGAGIFVGLKGEPLLLGVRQGDSATDASGSPLDGVSFASFKDPVIGGSPVEFAFIGKVKGNGVTERNDTGLWIGTGDSVELLAREGDQAVGAPDGARWSKFHSVVLGAECGPAFVADMVTGKGGVTSASKRGLWVLNSFNQLRMLVRQGDPVPGDTDARRVKTFTVLAPGKGVAGTARTTSASGRSVVARIDCTDGSSLLLTIAVP